MQCFTKQNYMVVVYVGANWSTFQLDGTFVFYIILHNQILIAFLAAFKGTPKRNIFGHLIPNKARTKVLLQYCQRLSNYFVAECHSLHTLFPNIPRHYIFKFNNLMQISRALEGSGGKPYLEMPR
jgi:hypothetical protein